MRCCVLWTHRGFISAHGLDRHSIAAGARLPRRPSRLAISRPGPLPQTVEARTGLSIATTIDGGAAVILVAGLMLLGKSCCDHSRLLRLPRACWRELTRKLIARGCDRFRVHDFRGVARANGRPRRART